MQEMKENHHQKCKKFKSAILKATQVWQQLEEIQPQWTWHSTSIKVKRQWQCGKMVDDSRVCCWFISLHSYTNFSLVQDMKLVITLERSTVHYSQVCKKSWVIQCSQSSLFSQCSHRCCFMPVEIMLVLREEWYCRGSWNCSHGWQQKMKTFCMITSKISQCVVK